MESAWTAEEWKELCWIVFWMGGCKEKEEEEEKEKEELTSFVFCVLVGEAEEGLG